MLSTPVIFSWGCSNTNNMFEIVNLDSFDHYGLHKCYIAKGGLWYKKPETQNLHEYEINYLI